MGKLDKLVVTGLKNEQETLKDENKGHKSFINELQSEMNELGKRIEKVKTQIAENDRRLKAIQHTFDEFENEDAAETEVDSRRRW